MKEIILITAREIEKITAALKITKKKRIQSEALIRFYAENSEIFYDRNDDLNEITSNEEFKLELERLIRKSEIQIGAINTLINNNLNLVNKAYKIKKNRDNVVPSLEIKDSNKLHLYFSEDKTLFFYECKLNQNDVINSIKDFIYLVLEEVKSRLDQSKAYKFTLLVHRDDIAMTSGNVIANKNLIYYNTSIQGFENADIINWDKNNCFTFSHNNTFIHKLIKTELEEITGKTSADILYKEIKNYFKNQEQFLEDEKVLFKTFSEDSFKKLKDNMENNFQKAKIF